MERRWGARGGWSICESAAVAYKAVANGDSYGMVLAKEKNNEKALEYLIRSVHLFPMNWGCWLEIASLISRVEDVSPTISLARQPKLTTPAQPHSKAPPPKHRLVHLPHPRLPRALPAGPLPRQLPRPAPRGLPNIRLPPHMQRPPLLPLQGFCRRGAAL